MENIRRSFRQTDIFLPAMLNLRNIFITIPSIPEDKRRMLG